MMKRIAALVALPVLAVSALSGCAPTADAGPAEVTKLTVAVFGSAEEAVIDIAEEQGWLAEAGLEVEKTVIGAPPATIAATAAGQVDLAILPVVPLLNALTNDVPLVVVAAGDGLPAEDPNGFDSGILITSPESGITSVAGLAGKTIAVPARGGLFEVVITASLVNAGVDPTSINWVEMGFGPALTAVADKKVDAAPMIAPLDAQAIADGMVTLAHPNTEFLGDGLVDVWVTSAAIAESKHDAIAALRDIIYKAADWANNNVDAAKQIGIDIMGVDLTVDQVTPMYYETSLDVSQIERANQRMIDLGFLDSMATIPVFE